MSSKTTINIKNKFDRVVVLVDMDCFYCQVEEKLTPAIRGKPIAVVQYNPWQGGGIIAVNYPARAEGVTRHMRGDEAKQHCPDIELPQVPQVRGKADLTRYREAGKEVADVLKSFTPLLERASIDEAYLDITERVLSRIREMNEGKFQLLPEKLANTFAVGYENIGEFVKKLSNTFDAGSAESNATDRLEYKKSDIKLLVGASIVNEIRAAVKEKTGYECSAGIAHNKILAKLTAGFHKPNKQTILPIDSITKLYETLPLKKVKGLGGKLGDQVCEVLKIRFMSELVQFPESVLQHHFEERMGSWMYLMARGIDLEAVTAKFHSKSIGCCKRFPGKNAITGLATLNHWLNELASEVTERLEKDMDENNRTAKQLTVSYSQQIDNVDVSSTRSIPLVAYDKERIAVDALEAIKRNTERFFKPNSTTALHNAVKFLGISAGKFEPNGNGKGGGIKQMFQSYSSKTGNADGGPSETERRTSVSEPLATTDPPKTEASHEETQHIDKAKEEPTGVGENSSKPRGNIKHFLQHQASLASSSTSDRKESEAENSKSKPLEASSTCGELNEVETKPKKGIKQFLQPKSAIYKGSVTVKEPTEEKGDDTKETIASLCEENQREALNIDQDSDLSEQKTRQDDKPEEIASHSRSSCEKTNATVSAIEALDKSSDYKATYAEYFYAAVPEPPASVTVECPQCRKQIPEYEYQSHQDFHFALSLSQQQRDEFRNDLKSKIASKSPLPSKRSSKAVTSSTAEKTSSGSSSSSSSASSSTSTNLSIARFLSKVSPESTRPSSTDMATSSTSEKEQPEDHFKCTECGKLIKVESMAEHNDYHVAKRLQQELNRLEPPSQPIVNKPLLAVGVSNTPGSGISSSKRKRPSIAGEEAVSPVKQKLKPVSSYFTKL
ncbi:DNA polymerase eta [Anopheles funestus]|uniref:DNA polymerase eta n=1 Tax=Anopheles funestus TaxID=62324 RepID=UPI0020C68B0D|nr:DNA polymerase eta [Anopheles funestus]